MSQKKKTTQKQSPLTKATTAELSAVLLKRGMLIIEEGAYRKQIESVLPKEPCAPTCQPLMDTKPTCEPIVPLFEQLKGLNELANYPNQDIDRLFDKVQATFGIKLNYSNEEVKPGENIHSFVQETHQKHLRNYKNFEIVINQLIVHLG